jgi:hypothetical protein
MNAPLHFVIIGAAKSGSTWLHLSLRQHPAVYMPSEETSFLEDPHYDENDLSTLQQAVASAPTGAVVGIKCPNYLCAPECAARLARHFPRTRLLAILRNPVDRAISQYYHLIRSGRIPVVAPDIAFSRYLAGAYDPPYVTRQVIGFGLYAEGIARYLSVFPAEQLLVVTDQDLQCGAREVFKRVCRFLQVDDTLVPAGISMPRNQGVYSLPLLSFIQSLNRYGHEYDVRTGVATFRAGLASWAARRLALLASRVSGATRLLLREQRADVSLKTRAELLEFYLPDIIRLEAMMNIDLSAWKVVPRSRTLPGTAAIARNLPRGDVRHADD